MTGFVKRAIGVDIGSHRVKVVVLRKSKKGIELEKFFVEPLPYGSIIDHHVIDGFLVGEILSKIVKASQIRGKEVASILYGKGVMIKKIVTDSMTDSELAAAIPYEAEQNLPFDMSEVSLDYVSLPNELDTEGMEVLLVAAKNDLVHSVVDTLRNSGCKLGLLEVEPFALHAAFSENGDIDDKSTIAVLQIGFQGSSVTLFNSGQFEGTRYVNIAGKTYVEELIRHRGITFERAMAILSGEKLTQSDEIALEKVSQLAAERLTDAVIRSFPSNFGPVAEQPVGRILLCGGGAHLPGIVPMLTDKFGVEVEVADPLRFALPVVDGREDELEAVAPDLTTAIGLALRGLGDLYPGFNLLPSEERKGWKGDRFAGASVVLPILGFAILFLVMVIMTVVQENKLGILRGQLNEVQKEAALYAGKIAVVNELTSKRSDITERIKLIEKLDHARFLRIHILDEINRALPSLTWLTSVAEKGNAITIMGVTSSNLKVATLMENLVESPYLANVTLTVTEKSEIAHSGVTKFTLEARVTGTSQKEPETPTKQDAIAQGTRAIKEARAAQAKKNP